MTVLRTTLMALVAGLWSGAALACPDRTVAGPLYLATGPQLNSARHFAVQAQGAAEFSRCPGIQLQTSGGPGYFDRVPNATFRFEDVSAHQVMISVIAHCDAMILVEAASGQFYYDDNDNGGTNPRIIFANPRRGWYDIWVGSRDGRPCDAILSVESFSR